MKKMTFTFFLIAIGCIASFAQERSIYPGGKFEKDLKKVEKICYETTKSYADFKGCVENGEEFICPKNGLTNVNYPCRDRDHHDIPRRSPADITWARPDYSGLNR